VKGQPLLDHTSVTEVVATFFPSALKFSRNVKSQLRTIRSVFGGHHVTAAPEVYDLDGIDTIVVGPVYGTIDKIVANMSPKVIKGYPIPVSMMMPARREYFETVENIGSRHRKTIMSHFGCPYNCSYCSTSCLRSEYGSREYRKYWLTRRPIELIIEEARSSWNSRPRKWRWKMTICCTAMR